jgi:DNA-binding response OmpR family regulator
VAKILIVDDEASSAEVLRHYLDAAGHQVIVCLDSTQGESMIADEKPDLAVFDYKMPGKSGTELLADIRSGLNTRRIPVIFVSGTAPLLYSSQVPQEARVRFLSKPVDADSLLAAVTELLNPEGWSTAH